MAQDTRTVKLDVGETFPDLSLSLVGGDSVSLPDDTAGDWTVLLVYRGHW